MGQWVPRTHECLPPQCCITGVSHHTWLLFTWVPGFKLRWRQSKDRAISQLSALTSNGQPQGLQDLARAWPICSEGEQDITNLNGGFRGRLARRRETFRRRNSCTVNVSPLLSPFTYPSVWQTSQPHSSPLPAEGQAPHKGTLAGLGRGWAPK